MAFIKPSNYEKAKTRKFKKDISRIENMAYAQEENRYTCAGGKAVSFDYIKNVKTKTGHIREVSVYSCKDCKGCPQKASCIKGNNCKLPLEERNKRIEVSRTFVRKREECLERINSKEGKQLRMNRSIQAEGSFSELKDGMGFRRYMSRGKKNVLAESVLLAMARNLNKLHTRIQSGRTGTHLYELKSA